MKKQGKLSTILGFLLVLVIIAKLSSCGSDSSDKDASSDNTPSETVVETEAPSIPAVDYSGAPHLYVHELMRNYSWYEGQAVQVYVDDVSYVTVSYDHVSVDAEDDDEVGFYAAVPEDNAKVFSNAKTIIIGGTIRYEPNSNKVHLDDAVILGNLSTTDAEYQQMKAAYDEQVRQAAIEKENNFKASAVPVSYDDLLRYPSQWENVPIYLTVQVTKIQSGILDTIMGAPIQCVIPGTNNELVIYDTRDVKEPTILEGDTITFYGYGDGLTVIKIKDTSHLINKTVDSYEVPAVCMTYNK